MRKPNIDQSKWHWNVASTRIIKIKKQRWFLFFCWIIKKEIFNVNSSTSRHVILMSNITCTTRNFLELLLELFTKRRNSKTPTIKPRAAVVTKMGWAERGPWHIDIVWRKRIKMTFPLEAIWMTDGGYCS